MKRAALLSVLLLLAPSTAQAKVSSITIAKPIAEGRFSDGAGDQVSALLSDARGPIVIGTVEGAPAEWLSAAKLGGTDGFITHFSFAGLPTWSLRLGTTTDDIATAAVVAKSGEIWVVGSTAPARELNTLIVWEISATGALLNTFQTSATGVIYPHSIVESASGFTIAGEDFNTTITSAGVFSPLKIVTYKAATPAKLLSFKGTTYSWRIYTGKGPLIGIPTFKPKSAQTIYYKVLNSNTTVKAAYQLSPAPLFARYQLNVGIALISESANGFALSLLK